MHLYELWKKLDFAANESSYPRFTLVALEIRALIYKKCMVALFETIVSAAFVVLAIDNSIQYKWVYMCEPKYSLYA